MPALLITCPNTGETVSTGISVPEDIDLTNFKNNQIKCPRCGEVHTWDGSDAFFEGV